MKEPRIIIGGKPAPEGTEVCVPKGDDEFVHYDLYGEWRILTADEHAKEHPDSPWPTASKSGS